MAGMKKWIGKVGVEISFNISLWQAIKLRIAGDNYKPIVEEILKEMRDNFKQYQGD